MKIGFLGASKILNQVIQVFDKYKDKFELEAIASKSNLDKAKEFQNKYHINKVYDSYLDLVNDPEIDLIYISTITSAHYNDIKLCLNHHKHVICEKSFTVKTKETEELILLAKKNNLYLAEAIWTRYMPYRDILKTLIEQKIIGNIKFVTANLGYDIKNKKRLLEPTLGGGSLLDVGVYPLNFIDIIASILSSDNEIVSFDAKATLTNLKVDESLLVNLRYSSGLLGQFYSTINYLTTREGLIYGDDGLIKVTNINNPEKIEIFKINKDDSHKFDLINSINLKNEVNGYEYQFLEAYEMINNKKIEAKSMPLNDTLRMMKIMNKILKDIKCKTIEC